jgi:hypothetical protein
MARGCLTLRRRYSLNRPLPPTEETKRRSPRRRQTLELPPCFFCRSTRSPCWGGGNEQLDGLGGHPSPRVCPGGHDPYASKMSPSISRDRCATRVWCRPGLRVDCAATTLSSRAGRTSTHSCYWCGFSMRAHEGPLGYCFGLCKLLADVVSPRPQSAGHVVCVCAHENSSGYRFALCNLLAR